MNLKLKIGLLFISLSICFNNGARAEEKVVFTPQWSAQAQFAGYYVAHELGYYSSEGLDVEIKHPTTSTDVVQEISDGQTDIISSFLSIALLNRDEGCDLVNFMQLIQDSYIMIVSNKPLDGSIESLRGMRIATWKSDFSASVVALFKSHNVEVEWIYHLSGANIFLSDCVDAIVAMEYNELQTIIESGRRVDPSNVIFIRDIRGNIPDDGLYASAKYAARHPERLDKFRRASIRGWQWAEQNREAALDIVMDIVNKYNVPTNKYHQRKMLNVILDGISDDDRQGRFNLSQETFTKAYSLLYDNGVISRVIDYNDFVFK